MEVSNKKEQDELKAAEDKYKAFTDALLKQITDQKTQLDDCNVKIKASQQRLSGLDMYHENIRRDLEDLDREKK